MRAKPRILLVNGNSSQSVTDRLAGLAMAAAPEFEFRPYTPQGGPAYVSNPADVALAAEKVVDTIAIAARDEDPDGCLIACFGEPGLLEARRNFNFPVVGMAEASMLTAMQLGGNFAILTLGEYWPAMLRDLVKLYGVQDRCVGIERIEGTPFELNGRSTTRGGIRNRRRQKMRGADRDYRRRCAYRPGLGHRAAEGNTSGRLPAGQLGPNGGANRGIAG